MKWLSLEIVIICFLSWAAQKNVRTQDVQYFFKGYDYCRSRHLQQADSSMQELWCEWLFRTSFWLLLHEALERKVFLGKKMDIFGVNLPLIFYCFILVLSYSGTSWIEFFPGLQYSRLKRESALRLHILSLRVKDFVRWQQRYKLPW